MAVDTETFLHLSRPLAPTLHLQHNIAPLSVNVQPEVRRLFTTPSSPLMTAQKHPLPFPSVLHIYVT